MPVSAIPAGYHSLTPYLIVRDAAKAIDFYKNVFGAIETVRMPRPDRKVAHAELRIGDCVLMLADETPEMGIVAPPGGRGSGTSLLIYVPDVDTTFQRAAASGATVERAVQNQFYGDRSGTLVDPFGHTWTIATHIEDVTPDEMRRRMSEMGKKS